MFGRDRSMTSLLNDTFIRGILFQALIAIGLLLSINWLADNTLSNLANQGKTLGFDFLTRTAGFQISPTLGTWMLDYKVGKSTYTDVYLIGIINTFIVGLLGILTATVIGFTVGIMRLSDNLVFRWFSSFYVEVVRNVPLLLQLFFWYFAVLRAMPSKREKLELVEAQLNAQKDGNLERSDSIQTKMYKIVQRSYLYSINFALNNKDSEVAPFIAVSEVYDANVKYLDTINNVLPPKIANSKYGLILKDYIKTVKSK